jgi:SAM-dependent methyltransferase
MQDEPRHIVAAGYDELSGRYREWAARAQGDPRDRMLGEFVRRLPDGARVLDLGCGSGIPSARELARRFQVVGVDISEVQIRAARENIPDATFIQGDVADVELPDASFDGVSAFYAISHLPREEHAPLFTRIARWLVPGGLFLGTLGAEDDPRWVGDWLGVPMFFSSFDADTNRALLRGAGFALEVDEIVEIDEPEGAVRFLWVIARTPVDTAISA